MFVFFITLQTKHTITITITITTTTTKTTTKKTTKTPDRLFLRCVIIGTKPPVKHVMHTTSYILFIRFDSNRIESPPRIFLFFFG